MPIEKNESALNARQRKFCRNVRGGMGIDAAARSAGYCRRRYGYELLQKPEIAAELLRPPDGDEASPTATTEEIMSVLTAVMRGDISEDAPAATKSGGGKAGRAARKAPTIKERMDAANMLLKYTERGAEKAVSDSVSAESAVYIVGEDRLDFGGGESGDDGGFQS
ncbi:MAG: terminase small subunit [Clostridia bacterium]|nr:terminase small subunit [Clostridia bacterium]